VALSEIKVGFAFRYTLGAIGSVVSLWDWSDLQCYLYLDAGGHLDLYKADGTKLADGVKVLAESTWYYVEWYVLIAPVGAAWTVKIDGAEDYSAVTGSTQGATTDDIVYVRWGTVANSTHVGLYDMWVDDIYLVDPTDAIWPDEFLGDVRVDRLTLDTDATYQQWDAVGAASVEAATDDASPNDNTDYAFGNHTGVASTVYVNPMPVANVQTIFGVQVLACAQLTDTGEFVAPSVVSGFTFDNTRSSALTFNWDYVWEIFTLDPESSGTWNSTLVAGAEYGVTRTT
jgi:hypothetical protein